MMARRTSGSPWLPDEAEPPVPGHHSLTHRPGRGHVYAADNVNGGLRLLVTVWWMTALFADSTVRGPEAVHLPLVTYSCQSTPESGDASGGGL